MAIRMLEGEVQDERDTRIADLEQEVEDCRSEITQLKFQLADAQRKGTRGLTNLRRQLSPLYRALQDVFGELDKAGIADADASLPVTGNDARTKAIWEGWKSRLGGACAKMIDALLVQPGMTNRQLAVAIGTGRIQTIYDAVTKMNKVSLLTKDGDRYSLKQL